MWTLIIIVFLAVLLAGIWYLMGRIRKLDFIKKLTRGENWPSIFIPALCIAIPAFVLFITMDAVNMMICILHLGVIWALCDGIGHFINKYRKREEAPYIAGWVAIGVTVAWLIMGWVFAHHVVETKYDLATDKNLGEGIRIVQISDSHIGATFHAKEFAEYIQQINALNPDVLVITGDFVDDESSKEDMIGCCRALADCKATYGVYFVMGNHDRGYYASSRGYSGEDLIQELEKNGVNVLIDETVLVDDRFYLIGREDKSNSKRASMDSLVKDLDSTKYMVVLDHQPSDYKNQEAAGVDLVLSGHTHGGQFIPIQYMGEWTGINDMTYGLRHRGNTDFIVSSGIADWAIKFKTGCLAEIVVIDVK